MIDRLHGITIFCEDIREELGNKVSLIGILPDNLNLSSIPGTLPKLGIYTRIHIPITWEPCALKMFMSAPGTERMLIGETSLELMAESLDMAKRLGGLNGGLTISTIAQSFHIPEPGRIVLECEAPNETFVTGSLNLGREAA